jgi:hypothetical protein
MRAHGLGDLALCVYNSWVGQGFPAVSGLCLGKRCLIMAKALTRASMRQGEDVGEVRSGIAKSRTVVAANGKGDVEDEKPFCSCGVVVL